MRFILLFIIFVHGLIHLFGFLKSFGFAEFEALHQSIPKTHGLAWLICSLLLIISGILYLFNSDLWVYSVLIGIALSQVLIFIYWGDARFGSIPNIILLVAALLALASYRFDQKVNTERALLIAQYKTNNTELVTAEMISSLPLPVQRWMQSCGAVGHERVQNVYLTQEIQMLMSPEQTNWIKGHSDQVFNTDPPAFNWKVDMHMNAMMPVKGRDRFDHCNGEMLIKLLSVIPVANAHTNPKIDQASLQRFLAEIVWFPTAAINPYIVWEPVDALTVRATMRCGETSGSGIFHFNEDASFKAFTAKRYKDVKDTEPKEWTVRAIRHADLGGIRVPVECEVSWTLDGREWTWLKLQIKSVEYNIEDVAAIDTN